MAQAFGGFIHGPKQKVFTARGGLEMRAVGFDHGSCEIRQRAKRAVAGHPRQTPREGRCPSAQMFAQKSLLRLPAQGQFFPIKLIFERIGFFGGQNAQEFQLQADMVLAFIRVFCDLQTECAIKGREVCQAMRLKERIGFDIAVFDFVQRTPATRGMTKRG